MQEKDEAAEEKSQKEESGEPQNQDGAKKETLSDQSKPSGEKDSEQTAEKDANISQSESDLVTEKVSKETDQTEKSVGDTQLEPPTEDASDAKGQSVDSALKDEEPMEVDQDDAKEANKCEKIPGDDKGDKLSDESSVKTPPTDTNSEKNKSEKLAETPEKSLEELRAKLSPAKRSSEDKPFPTRLLEELVKPCTPKSDAGSSGLRSSESPLSAAVDVAMPRGSNESSREATPAPAVGPVQDSQSLQQPSREGASSSINEQGKSAEQNKEEKIVTAVSAKDLGAKSEDTTDSLNTVGENIESEAVSGYVEAASSLDNEIGAGEFSIRGIKARKAKSLKPLVKPDTVVMQDVGFNVDKYVNKVSGPDIESEWQKCAYTSH